MTIKTRLILLVICTVVFLVITPYIVLYSLGYRVDFANFKIHGTGGMYVYAVPEPTTVTIDSQVAAKTGLFSSAVFMQNLAPGLHHLEIKKEGYYGYQKNVQVKEKEVTKLEHVVLFKENTNFALLEAAVDYFSASPNENKLLMAKIAKTNIEFTVVDLTNNQPQTVVLAIANGKITETIWSENARKAVIKVSSNYYALDMSGPELAITALLLPTGVIKLQINPQNSQEIFFIKGKDLFSNSQTPALIKNVVAYIVSDQTITWLSFDGFFYESDLTGTPAEKITTATVAVKTGKAYEITNVQGMVFLQEDAKLFLLDPELEKFQVFSENVKGLKNSPDNQKILYFNETQILVSSNQENHQDAAVINATNEPIKDCYWLNNEYIVISAGDSIMISEIDNRGGTNIVTMPNTLALLQGEPLTVKNPLILLRQQDKKLYIFSQKTVAVSERLLP